MCLRVCVCVHEHFGSLQKRMNIISLCPQKIYHTAYRAIRPRLSRGLGGHGHSIHIPRTQLNWLFQKQRFRVCFTMR